MLKWTLIALSGLYIYGKEAMATTPDAQNAEFLQATLVEDIGASERVEAAGLLRILSQEVANAACHAGKGIDIEESRKLLLESKEKFTLLLDALQHGNPALNIIGAEERGKTIAKLQALRTQWTPVRKAAIRLLEDQNDAGALALIKAENEAILDAAYVLTSEIAGQYSNPAELLQADVMLLDFVGRQALLTQKMSKIACQIWSGNRAEDRLTLLTSIMQRYDLTLTALHDGMPTAGIAAAPTPEIKSALSKARKDWSVVQVKLDDLLASSDFEDARKTALYRTLNTAMYDMEAIEKLYVTFSKHAYE